MLQLNDILKVLGRSIEDGLLNLVFVDAKIDLHKELFLEGGLFTAHIEKKAEGISFTFTDEAMFLGIEDQELGDGPLYFSGVFFYSKGRDGYSAYEGELPEGLSFLLERQEIHQRLGPPAHQRLREDQTVIGDRWDMRNYSLSVTYSKNISLPVLVSLFVRY